MLIKSEEKYIPDLTKLWKDVFGDEDGYIALFFKDAYKEAKTFAHFENGKIISALYLLDGVIEIDKARYDGYYLYAAATKEEYRCQGIMAELINEVKQYANERNSFIALVPASEKLYSYYSRFSFVEAMHKFTGKYNSDSLAGLKEISFEEYYSLINNSHFDRFYKSKTNTFYSLDCLSYCGYSLLGNENGCVITNGSRAEEVLSENEDELKLLLSRSQLKQGTEINAPFKADLEEKIFGMVYTENYKLRKSLENKKIYMNLALD